MKQVRVLVTGAGGFVGGALAAGFAGLGARVTGLDRTFDADARARLSGVDLVEWDLALGEDGLHALSADVMIHAAALTTNPAALGMTEAEHITANMDPLLAMLRHSARTRPNAFVFLSSSGVFSEADGSPNLTDTDAATALGPYSAAKKAGEVLVPGALGGVCATHVVRLGYLYGPHEVARTTRARVSLVQTWVDAARAGQDIVVSATDARRDWTFVADLAPALARIVVGQGRGRPVHLCTPTATADRDVASAIAARFAGVVVRTGQAGPTKAPMAPSNLVDLQGFAWTSLDAGLDAICRAGVAA
jgi:nucleoside-diphosphate-sugar epimerase